MHAPEHTMFALTPPLLMTAEPEPPKETPYTVNCVPPEGDAMVGLKLVMVGVLHAGPE